MRHQYLQAGEMIKDTIIFGQEKNPSAIPTLHIAYGIDKNFVFGCGVSIASIILHNKEKNIVFHVFIDEISEEDKARFSHQAQLYDTSIQIHIVNCDKLKSFPTTKNWSVAMYFRFIIGDYFVGLEDRILYLDADIVCQGDIAELTTFDLGRNVIGAVTERDNNWWEIRARNLGYPGLTSGYFNSGVLLISTDNWSRESIFSKAMSMLSNGEITRKLSYMDQDILNIVLLGKVAFIDRKFNTQFSINYELKKEFICPISESTVLIHYVGPTKPWHEWADYPVSRIFLVAKAASSWQNMGLFKPINSHQFRYCAKHKFNQKLYIQGMLNYIKYYKSKLTG